LPLSGALSKLSIPLKLEIVAELERFNPEVAKMIYI